jgi:imidazolonepropionase-like amidohydrolase
MKSRPHLVIAAWLVSMLNSSTGLCQRPTPAVTAFLDVTVIVMDSSAPKPNQTVVVRGDRIAEISPAGAAKIPEDARHINGTGKFLMPGLGEMHGHNPPLGSSQHFVETVYFLFIANGVTTVRSMLGWPGQLELREKVSRGEMIGPTLYLAGPSFSGASIRSAVQAEQRVREQKAEGWDLLKVHPGLKRDHYDSMARTAKAVGIRFAGHIPADVGLKHAIEMGQETVDHLDGYIEYLSATNAPIDAAKLAEAVKFTRGSGAWVIPTMCLWETILGSAYLARMSNYEELIYMPPDMVEQWKNSYRRMTGSPTFDHARMHQVAANRKVLLKALSDGGAKILFGTDAPQQFSVPGFSIHREIKAMADSGMAPAEILKSATKTVGEYYSDKDRFGLVAPGYRADLLLLNASPLVDASNISRRAGVMVRGRWFDEIEIQDRLTKIARSYETNRTGTKRDSDTQ